MNKSTLLNSPDEFLVSVDDNAILPFLEELGILDRFPDERTLPAGATACVACDTVSSHVIVAFRHSGHKDKNKNGFELECYPKSGFTYEKIESLIDKRMNGGERFDPTKN